MRPNLTYFKGRKTKGKCMICDSTFPVSRKEWSRASRPKCLSCGGLLFLNGMWVGPSSESSKPANSISYPRTTSEFEIQAELYCSLRRRGIDVRGEVKTFGARFDLVVFVDGSPRLVIEVKKTKDGRDRGQIKKYQEYKVKTVVIAGMNDAFRFLDEFCRNYPDLFGSSDFII